MIRRSSPRDGLSLAWYDSGGQGLPVVFQHGLGGDHAQTREAFPDDPRYRLVTLECRGHGASDFGEPISIASFAEDLAALIETELRPPVVLGGISMGAAIATRLAVRRPDLVRALILARPAWIAEAAPANLAPNAEVGALLAAHSAEEARAIFRAGKTAQSLAAEAPDNLKSLLGFFDRLPAATTAALLSRISADGPGITREDLARCEIPALVLGTDLDAIHPRVMAEEIAALLPKARYATLTPKGLDKARHFADLQAALTAFLQEF